MLSDRAWMAVRVVLWVAIGAYVVTVLRKPEIGDEVGRTSVEMLGIVPVAEVPWVAVAPPAGAPAGTAAPGGAAEALLASQSLDAACALGGRELRLRFGAEGLVSAESRGPLPACGAAAVWAAAWPAVADGLELELTLP